MHFYSLWETLWFVHYEPLHSCCVKPHQNQNPGQNSQDQTDFQTKDVSDMWHTLYLDGRKPQRQLAWQCRRQRQELLTDTAQRQNHCSTAWLRSVASTSGLIALCKHTKNVWKPRSQPEHCCSLVRLLQEIHQLHMLLIKTQGSGFHNVNKTSIHHRCNTISTCMCQNYTSSSQISPSPHLNPCALNNPLYFRKLQPLDCPLITYCWNGGATTIPSCPPIHYQSGCWNKSKAHHSNTFQQKV